MIQKACEILRFADYGKQKTLEQKKERWTRNMIKRAEILENIQQRCVNKTQELEVAKLAVAEIQDGICPICRHMWRKVEFENQFGYVLYYEPSCECYPLCPNCAYNGRRTWLYIEQASGLLSQNGHHCPECGWQLLTEDYRKRWGPDYDPRQFEYDRREWVHTPAKLNHDDQG